MGQGANLPQWIVALQMREALFVDFVRSCGGPVDPGFDILGPPTHLEAKPIATAITTPYSSPPSAPPRFI